MQNIINPMFSELNWQRNIEVFKQEHADNKYWALAICEEAGELAGAVKKLERGYNQREYTKMIKKQTGKEFHPTENCPFTYEEGKLHWTTAKLLAIGKEAADVVAYVDLMMTSNKLDLSVLITSKFNEVSDEMKTDIKI